jgi:hypothetical protein
MCGREWLLVKTRNINFYALITSLHEHAILYNNRIKALFLARWSCVGARAYLVVSILITQSEVESLHRKWQTLAWSESNFLAWQLLTARRLQSSQTLVGCDVFFCLK